MALSRRFGALRLCHHTEDRIATFAAAVGKRSRQDRQLNAIVDSNLSKDLPQVVLHRLFRETQPFGNLPIAPAGRDVLTDSCFSFIQAFFHFCTIYKSARADCAGANLF